MKYGAILADPPWSFKSWSEKGEGKSAQKHYDTMSLPEIKELNVGETYAAKDCVLFMWAIDSMLPQALEVISAWGFEYKTVAFTWVKADNEDSVWRNEHFGMGYWTRGNPEMCLLATKGKPKKLSSSIRQLLVSPRREHSRKPDSVRPLIEALVPGPYLEMFARQKKFGWDAWGNQTALFGEAE